jgi:hypothetical protein
MKSTEAEKWEKLVNKLSDRFSPGEELDLNAILFLIGVQECGKGPRKYKKDDKINLMHIAICRLLEPYGFYAFEGYDEDGWPHYSFKEELPNLKPGEQSLLMKQAILAYFEEEFENH